MEYRIKSSSLKRQLVSFEKRSSSFKTFLEEVDPEAAKVFSNTLSFAKELCSKAEERGGLIVKVGSREDRCLETLRRF